MWLSTTLLILLIMMFLIYAIYDQFIMPNSRGETELVTKIKQSNRIDGAVFIGMIGLLWYNYALQKQQTVIGLLLLFLLIISIYCFFIRQPKLFIKSDGFFFANIFIPYTRITTLRFTENQQVLMVKLEHKEIAIKTKNKDELTTVYNKLVERSRRLSFSCQ